MAGAGSFVAPAGGTLHLAVNDTLQLIIKHIQLSSSSAGGILFHPAALDIHREGSLTCVAGYANIWVGGHPYILEADDDTTL
jgi:hypothetical protein